MIEKKLELTLLFDFYGELLTEKQREVMILYLIDDFGLVEIGENLGISRQAVYDKIKKSTKLLSDYETRLGLAGRYGDRQKRLENVLEQVKCVQETTKNPKLTAVIDDLQAILTL